MTMPKDLYEGIRDPSERLPQYRGLSNTQPGRQPKDLYEGFRDPMERLPQYRPQGPQQPEEPEPDNWFVRSAKGAFNTLNTGLNPFGIADDIKDVVQQGVTKTDSFPYFRLPESIGKRAEDRGDAMSNIAPYMIGGSLPTLAGAGVRGMALRSGAAAAGAGLSSVEQQVRAGEGIDPRRTAAAMALGGGGAGIGELAGAAIPAAARGLLRGGEKGRQGVASAIADAAVVDQVPTLAQATQSSFLDSLEGLAAKAPGGAGVIRDTVKKTTEGVRKGLEKIAQQGNHRVFDAEAAGQSIIGGVDDFVGRFQTRAGPLFDQVTKKVGANTPVSVSNTLSNLAKRVQPIPGAERTGERFTSPFIKSLADDLIADAGTQGQLPFQALQRVRSLVGEKLSNPGIVSDVPTAQLKQLYGAISDDIRLAAGTAGKDATAAFTRANAFYRAGQQRIQGTLEPLVKNKTPEQVFNSLMSGAKNGPTQIRTLYRSLTPAQEDVVTGSIIRKLGTANPGAQGAEGAEFSFNTFLTRWNQIDGKARDAIFKRGRVASMGQDINALARYAERVKESSKAFANPSGTSGATIGAVSGMVGAGSVAAYPLLGAGVLTFPVILGAGAGAANMSAKFMTSPRLVKWLAQSTKLSHGNWRAAVRKLGEIAAKEEPEVQAAVMEYFDLLDRPGGIMQDGGPPVGGNPNGSNAAGLLEGQMGMDGQPGLAAMGQAQAQAPGAQNQALMEELARAQQGVGGQSPVPAQAANAHPQLQAIANQGQGLQTGEGGQQIQAQLQAAQRQAQLAEEQRAMLQRFQQRSLSR